VSKADRRKIEDNDFGSPDTELNRLIQQISIWEGIFVA